jgi:uncharacterized protein YbcI
MSCSKAMEEQIVEAVVRFEQNQMSLNPTAILANLQESTLFVMLEGLSLPAEKACTRDMRSQERLEKYHARIFDTVRHLLESEIESIVGRCIERSTLRVEPVSGTGTMQFTLGNSTDKGDNGAH